MGIKLKRVLAGTVAAATVAGVAPIMMAAGASATTANGVATSNGTATMTRSSGTQTSGTVATDTFQLGLGTSPTCPNDGNHDYRWGAYMIPFGQDPGSIIFGPNDINQIGGQFRKALFDTSSQAVVNRLPGLVSTPPAPITTSPDYYLDFLSPIPDGTYTVGVACYKTTDAGTDQVKTYWTKTMTISGSGSNWAAGGPAVAPVITAGVPAANLTSANITVNVPDSDPDVGTNGFTVTADGPGADDHTFTTTLPETNGQIINVPGLTLGNTYAITVTANNGVGTPTVSNTQNVTIASVVAGPAPIGTNAAGHVNFTWPAYTPTLPSGVTVTGFNYSYTVNGGGTTTGTLAASATSLPQVNGAAGDVVVLSLTPTFSSTGVSVSAPSTATATVLANAIVQQVLTATRPVGTLVLTQVCGRTGSLPLEAAGLGAGQAGIGFPAGLPAVVAANNGDDTGGTGPLQNGTQGTAPQLTVGVGGNPPAALGNPNGSDFTTTGTGNAAQYVPVLGGQDTVFGSYPYPDDPTTGVATPTYPTVCGVSFPTARFVDQGSQSLGRGQFYATSAQINQVTVVDTRDTDPGWNAAASVTDFQAPGGKSFSGNQLGWTPHVNRTTPGFPDALGNTYTQTVVVGGQVQQNQLISSGNGLKAGVADTLASAAPHVGTTTGGLGIAVLDARLKLAIPVTAPSGNYTAVLTFTAV